MKPKLDLIGIITNDMKASFEFYRRLGFDIPDGLDAEDHAEIKLDNGLRFAWDSINLVKMLFPDHEYMPNHHLAAFLCDNPQEVDKKYKELTAAGYKGVKEPWDAFWGQRYAVVADPDDHYIDLFAPLEAQ